MKFLNKKWKTIPDKWLIIPAILLGLNFFYRLVNMSKIISTFPLQYIDVSSYMAQLFFLVKCGFYKICPYWYNGFVTFKSTPPGWFLFALPIYWLTENIQLSTYLSIILIFILIFAVIFFFGKLNRFSNVKIITFFFFLFANAIAVGNFIRLMRVHELFGWLNFIIIAFTALWYKNRIITKKFYLIIIPLSLAILSHQYVAILSFVIIFSLFLAKKRIKEKIKIIVASILSLLITSFWWIPFLLSFEKTSAPELLFSKTLFLFTGQWFWQNITTILIPFLFCLLFYFYWISNNRSKKELLFFITPLLISLLLMCRIVYFIPILKHIYPDSYNHMFLFFSIFMFFKINIKKFPGFLEKSVSILLFFIVLISILFSIFYTPFFTDYSNLERNTLNVLNRTTGKFLILKSPPTIYPPAYYSYASIRFNLTTPSGFHPHPVPKEYIKVLKEPNILLENKKCNDLNQILNYLNTTHVITYNQYCSYLEECGLKEKAKKTSVCLFITVS